MHYEPLYTYVHVYVSNAVVYILCTYVMFASSLRKSVYVSLMKMFLQSTLSSIGPSLRVANYLVSWGSTLCWYLM